MEQIPPKEFMRRLANIDNSLSSIAKSLAHLEKVIDRQHPRVTLVSPQREEEEEDSDE